MTGNMVVAEAVEAFLDHRRAKRVSSETIRIYSYWMTTWQQWRWREHHSPQLTEISIEQFRAFFKYLEEEYVPHGNNPRRPADDKIGLSPSSQAGGWRVLRSLWIFCENEDWLTAEQKRFFVNGRIPCPQVEEEIRPHCDEDTLGALLNAAGDGDDEQSARDYAIVAMLFESGLRISEICSLTDEAVDFKKRQAKVKGKGKKHDHVFWGTRTAIALRRYMRLRRGKDGGPLFRGVSSRNNGGAMTDDAVRCMIKRLGVEVPPGAPVHFIRHGFAHKLLKKVSEFELQQLMRHRSMETTRRYTRENPDDLHDSHGQAFD